jgi:4-amino-4-deoxy-L-arabinose transferase-like glycosyltransferase
MKIRPMHLVVAALLMFVLIESKGLLHYDNVDENVYFYMGKLVSEGKMPYRDFFFAHPPLQVFVNAAIFKLFGFKLFLLKAVPLITTAISAVFVYKIMRKRFGASEALIAMVLFLFSYRVMLEATYALGMNLTTMFVIVGTYCVLCNRHLTSGLLFGLAAITGLYSVVPAAVIAAFALMKNRKRFIRFATGFLAVFLAVNLFFIAIAGGKFIEMVYKYHLVKPETAGNTLQLFVQALRQNWLIFGSAALFVLVLSKKLALPTAVSAAYILFLTQLSKIFSFYFVLLFPFLAMLGGYALVRAAKKVPHKKVLVIAFAAVVAVNAGYTAHYLWTFDFVNFQSAKPMAGFVKENSAFSDEVFGDMTAAPLIALFSNRKIAFDMVDTNDMLFQSKMISLKETTSKIKQAKTKFVIVNQEYGIGSFKEFNAFLEKDCSYAKAFSDQYWGRFVIYDCSQS